MPIAAVRVEPSVHGSPESVELVVIVEVVVVDDVFAELLSFCKIMIPAFAKLAPKLKTAAIITEIITFLNIFFFLSYFIFRSPSLSL